MIEGIACEHCGYYIGYCTCLQEEEVDKEIIEKLAQEVLRGTFGNGETRKQALGALYAKVQNRVNQILEEK